MTKAKLAKILKYWVDIRVLEEQMHSQIRLLQSTKNNLIIARPGEVIKNFHVQFS